MNVIINLNKPSGMTSQQAVSRVKRICRASKTGHAGTLDPLATGILLVCLDEATKISRFLMNADKKYRVKVKLGERTDTLDSDGSIVERCDVSHISGGVIEETAASFVGCISQVPPMYSAVKIGGRALHDLARKGIEIERPERTVVVYDIAVEKIDLPFFDMVVSCSKGTYIRTLCDDIGSKLGVGAHVVKLERIGSGLFDVRNSVDLDVLEKQGCACDGGYVLSIDKALYQMDDVFLCSDDATRARNGIKIRLDKGLREGSLVKMKEADGRMIGIGVVKSGFLCVERNLNL